MSKNSNKNLHWFIDGKDMAMPGEDVQMNLKLNKQMTIKAGQQFTIRSAGVTVGSGKVSYWQ